MLSLCQEKVVSVGKKLYLSGKYCICQEKVVCFVGKKLYVWSETSCVSGKSCICQKKLYVWSEKVVSVRKNFVGKKLHLSETSCIHIEQEQERGGLREGLRGSGRKGEPGQGGEKLRKMGWGNKPALIQSFYELRVGKSCLFLGNKSCVCREKVVSVEKKLSL